MRLIDVNAFLARDELRGGTIDWWWGVSLESEVLKDFPDGEKEYAILSHRWKEEVDYTEMAELMRFKPEDRVKIKGRAGYQKILNSCKQAKAEKIEWLWADTCCIDKRSSSELSEAINSMYRWYENSKICYTYLHDVDVGFFPTGPNGKKFPKSDGWPEWFSRGWTLQELIAPRNLKFFNKDWKLVGTKEELAGDLNKITRIPEDVLKHGLTSNRPCVAQIMSWAANRKTTRDEDRAYSLLGLLDVNMPMLYGEGKNAFQRLQLDIIRKSDDQSIFAWGHGGRGGGTCSVLADDPSFFRDCHDIVKIEPDEFDFHLRARLRVTGSPLPDERGSFSVTNQGIRIWLLVTPHEKSETFFRAVLACCRWDRRPITIDLASWGSSYYRYPSTPKVPKTIPKLQRLYLSYHPEVYPDCVFELEGVHRTLTSRGFTSRGLFPLESHNTRNLHYGKSSHVLSGVNALSVLVYEKGHRPKTRFAVVSGYFHGHPWVHVTLDDHEEGNSQEYAESVYNQTWAAGTHRIARSSLLNNTHVHLTSPGWANCAVEHRCTEYGKPNESTFSKVTIKLVRCTTKHCDEQKSLDDIVRSSDTIRVLTQLTEHIPDLNHQVNREPEAKPHLDHVYYSGTLSSEGKRVIVKRCQSKYIDQKYAFYEPFIWSLLNNENIHPFLGIVTTFDESVSTVAEWVDGKDAYTYVQDPKADPSSLLLGLARALHYLHSHPHGQIIHGDVQGSNVLVADNNRAWLTNFSCSVMRSVNMTLIPCNVGDFRWRAPEHVKAGVGISAAGDVWAFGMTILELFSANPPFQGEPSEPSLCDRIQQGLLPQRPTRMTDKWWKLCTSCWKLDATSRPSMSTLVGKTKEITA